jgi:hypothetical protein
MKRYIITLFFALISITQSFAQFTSSVYYDGYWGNWHKWANKLYGNYGGMIVYNPNYHRSLYQFKFSITNYRAPSKDEIKQHWKSKEWFVYYGVVEYYVTDDYPTIKDALKKFNFPAIFPKEGPRPIAKRTANATIKIAPYKNHPKVYNIFFEDVGFAIDLEDSYF